MTSVVGLTPTQESLIFHLALESPFQFLDHVSFYNPLLPGEAQCQSPIWPCDSTDLDCGTASTRALAEQNTLDLEILFPS